MAVYLIHPRTLAIADATVREAISRRVDVVVIDKLLVADGTTITGTSSLRRELEGLREMKLEALRFDRWCSRRAHAAAVTRAQIEVTRETGVRQLYVNWHTNLRKHLIRLARSALPRSFSFYQGAF